MSSLSCFPHSNRFAALLLLGAVAGCDAQSQDAGFELAEGLVDTGKADAVSGVLVGPGHVALRSSAARTLYNLMHDAGAQSLVGDGLRLLRGPATACITNGEATYCELYGKSELLSGADFEARIGGQAARYIRSLNPTAWFSCNTNTGNAACRVETSEALTLEFEQLEDLGSEYVYEGWAVSDAFGALTTSRFSNANGPIYQRVPKSVAAENPTFILTIEGRRGDPSAPAATHLVAGALSMGSESTLDTQHPAALGTDFAQASGAYLLASPTTPEMSDNDLGVWFLDPATGSPSLSLPTLPEGWVYEGWVVGEEGPVSTGRFSAPTGPDSDGAGPRAGAAGSPPFPGQDFISPPLSIVGKTVVVSVEPEPDNSAAPFSIKPLVDVVAEDIAAPGLQSLQLMNANRPHGRALLGNGTLTQGGQVWTADRGSGSVTVIEAATQRAVQNIVLGSAEPMYVNYSERTDRVFVGDRKNDRVLVLSPQTRKVIGEISVGAGVFHQWLNEEQLWVNSDEDRTTSVIDIDSQMVVATIVMPLDLASMAGTPRPHDVFVTASGDAAFVSYVGFAGDKDFVVRFDTVSFLETHRAAVGKDPHLFALAGSDEVYVTSQGSSEVVFFERSTLTPRVVIDLPGAHGITASQDGRLYITNTPGAGEEAVFTIDVTDGIRLNDFGVDVSKEGKPHNATLNAAGNQLFVTHSGPRSQLLSVFAVSPEQPTPVLQTEVRVGANPFGLGFIPAR